MPADCIYKVISQHGEGTLFERLSTLRFAPKIVFKSAWQSQQRQQQQPDTSESSASGTRKLVREEDQGTPTDNPEPPSIWKQMRSAESIVVKEEPEFIVHLRIGRFAQDIILEMTWRSQKKTSSSAMSRVAQVTNLAILNCTS